MCSIILARSGAFDTAHLDCESCQLQHDDHKAGGYEGRSLKEDRGCGVPPVTRGGGTWNEAKAAEWLEEGGLSNANRGPYFLANLGNVSRAAGWLWAHCPKWYLEFSDADALERAFEIMELQEWKEQGALASYVSGTLSNGAVDLIQLATRLIHRIRRDAEEAALAKRGKK